jgi:hypothetical protein
VIQAAFGTQYDIEIEVEQAGVPGPPIPMPPPPWDGESGGSGLGDRTRLHPRWSDLGAGSSGSFAQPPQKK